MPSEDTPIVLNKSDFWIQNCVRSSIRASNSFKVPDDKQSLKSAIFTDAELSDLMSQLPFGRQTFSKSFSKGSFNPSSHSSRSTTQFASLRTSRSVERQVLKMELQHMEQVDGDLRKFVEQQKQANITTLQQRNQLMKINEGLAKYIAHNTK